MNKPPRTPEAIAQELARMKARLESGPTEAEPSRPRGMGFFEAILHHVGEPVAVLKDGLHIFANPPYASLTGRSREELLTLHFESLLDAESRKALAEAMASLGDAREETEVQARLEIDPKDSPARSWRLQRFLQGGTTYVRLEPIQRALPSAGGRSSLDSLDHALALTLPSTHLASVSPCFCELLGHPAHALTRMTWSDLLPPDQLERLDLALGQGRRTGHAQCRVSLRRGDGTWLEALLEVLPWLGRAFQGEGVLVMVRPAPTDEEPQSDASGYRQVFVSMTEAYALHEVITDAQEHPVNYRFLEVNPAWEAFTGLASAQVVGRTVLEVQPDTEPFWIERYGQVALTGETASFEQYSASLGKHFRVMLQSPRKGLFSTLAVDITGERALEQSRQRLLSALEQTRDAIAIITREGAPLIANRAMRQLMSCRCEGCDARCETRVTCNLRAFLKGTAREPWEALLCEDQQPSLTWQGRLTHRLAEGSPMMLDTTFQRVEQPDGSIGDYLCVLRDVTREERLERAVRQTEKMDALGKLAGGIAHDFNNVLATILAAAELLEWQIPEHGPGRDKIEAIRLAGHRAQELNRRILTFARGGETTRTLFDLSALVKEVTGMLKTTMPGHVEVRTRLASSIWCQGDPNQVLQVVMNLTVNAFQSMKAREGLLELRLAESGLEGEALPTALAPGRYALLEVKDQGEGIPPDVLARVFEPFFTTKPEGEGTGLGLFVAHGIVANHRGHLQLDSTPDQGTRARMYLPCADPSQVPHEVPSAQEPLGEETLLLVGGEPLWAALTSEGLRHYGYTVASTLDPTQALERLRVDHAALQAVILDQSLQGMAASTFLERVKSDFPHLPVLLLTEAGKAVNPGEGRHDDLVVFPATPKDIARVLRRMVDAFQPPATAAKSAAAQAPHTAGKPLILLAEDSQVTRHLLRSWLQKVGYAVLEAADGQIAWEAFRERGASAFAAVLTDLVMPNMDGLQLVAQVREADPTLPTLILSTQEDAESLKAVLQVQASAYLTKPFTSQTFVESLTRLLDEHSARRATQQHMETILAVRRAQRSLVPVPEADLPIFSVSQPLTDAGGDVLRCLRLEDDSILFVLADVAGHSVLSSYAVASFLGQLSTFGRQIRSLPDLAQRLNRSIQEGPFHEIPVCALLGNWHPATGRLHLLNAGIPHGLLHRKRTGQASALVVNGTPLGIFEEPMVEERVLWLEEGDRLLFATDGIFEIRGRDAGFFSDLAREHWTRLAKAPLEQELGKFVETAREFGEGQLVDDLLVMAFEQPSPTECASYSTWIPSRANALDRVSHALKDHLAATLPESRLSSARRFDIILAARELLTNALYHGNRERPGSEIHLRCRVDEPRRSVELRVCDEGTGFDLANHCGPEDPLSERGRGIPFIRAIGGELSVVGGEVCMNIPLEG